MCMLGEDVVPIPGTTKIRHLKDNLESRKILLSKEECDTIARLIKLEEVSGDRYVGGSTALTFRDQMK
jgi:diketogulonate reductase-like aldo/keto reductase